MSKTRRNSALPPLPVCIKKQSSGTDASHKSTREDSKQSVSSAERNPPKDCQYKLASKKILPNIFPIPHIHLRSSSVNPGQKYIREVYGKKRIHVFVPKEWSPQNHVMPRASLPPTDEEIKTQESIYLQSDLYQGNTPIYDTAMIKSIYRDNEYHKKHLGLFHQAQVASELEKRMSDAIKISKIRVIKGLVYVATHDLPFPGTKHNTDVVTRDARVRELLIRHNLEGEALEKVIKQTKYKDIYLMCKRRKGILS